MRHHDTIGELGRYAARGALYPIDLLLFTYHVTLADNPLPRLLSHDNLKGFVTQTIFTGIDALKPISLMALAVGAGFIAPLVVFTLSLGSQSDVVTLLVDLIVVELGSLLTAFILIARTASAITVDLAQMKLHREIRALESLGIDIRTSLLMPRILGCAVSQLVLAIYFSFLTVSVAVFVISIAQPINMGSYFHAIATVFSLADLLVFSLKNLTFGIIIAVISCFEGLRADHSATEIPQRTQSAVINSLFFVLLVNVLSTLAASG